MYIPSPLVMCSIHGLFMYIKECAYPSPPKPQLSPLKGGYWFGVMNFMLLKVQLGATQHTFMASSVVTVGVPSVLIDFSKT